MLKINPLRLSLSTRCCINDSFKRFFLSDAYKCEEAWKNRLKNPIFQKLQLQDVDLLLNGAQDASFKNELEDVILQIRLTPEGRILPERSIHAAIRWYMENTSTEDLLNALSDRLNYGLFPDYYLNNMLMDKYLKKDDSVTAVKIAVLQMLQEDFDHPIMKVLALHCCYKYLESPAIWKSYKEPEPDPDEEVKKIRVRFLRNPYFDDHFDITDTNHLVGKTLWLFGRTVEGAVGTSSQLVGLVLYEKYEKCAEFLNSVIQNKQTLYKDAVEKAKNYILKKPKQEEEEKSEVKAEDGQEEGKEEVKALDEEKVKVLELLEKVSKGNLESGTLLAASADLVKKAVMEYENTDIKHQCEVYQQWEIEREEHIKEEIERIQSENVKAEIRKMKTELREEEEKLFFFDREEEIQFRAEENEKIRQSLPVYKAKRKMKDKSEDLYIPPTVGQKS